MKKTDHQINQRIKFETNMLSGYVRTENVAMINKHSAELKLAKACQTCCFKNQDCLEGCSSL